MFDSDRLVKGLEFINDFILNVNTNVPVIDNSFEQIKNLVIQSKGLIHAHVEHQGMPQPINDVIATAPVIQATQDSEVATTNIDTVTSDVILTNTCWADDQPKTDVDDNADDNAWNSNTPRAIRVATSTTVGTHVTADADMPFIQVRPATLLMLRPAKLQKIRVKPKKTTLYFTDSFAVEWVIPTEDSFIEYNVNIGTITHKQMCHSKNGKIFTLTVRGVPFFLDINRNLYFMSERHIKKYTNEVFIDDNNKYFDCADKWVSAIKLPGATEYTQGYFDHGDAVYNRTEFIPPNRHEFVLYD